MIFLYCLLMTYQAYWWQDCEDNINFPLCLLPFKKKKKRLFMEGEGRMWLKQNKTKHLYIEQLLSKSPHTEIKRT